MKKIFIPFLILLMGHMAQSQVTIDVCAGDTLELSVTVTLTQTLQWQQSLDGTAFYDIPGATMNSYTLPGAMTTRWYRCQITGTECNPWFTEVKKVNVNQKPLVSINGFSSTHCLSGNIVALTGVPAGGQFSGTGITGSTFNPATAGAGSHTILYTFTDGNGCTNQASLTTNVVVPPTTANAGPDITATGITVTLAGNTPVNGTGLWSVASGTGGSFGTPASPTSTFTGSTNSIYHLVWTITNPPCAPSTDTVMVTMPTGPSLPNVSCGSPAYTLYVHPTDNGTSAYGCSGIVAGASDDNNGASNTFLVVQMCGQATAAAVCDNLVAFGFSDWYLPSYNELECLRVNAVTIGGFASGAYWSSTEGSGILSANAKYRTFPSGVNGHGSKSTVNKLRCVRKD